MYAELELLSDFYQDHLGLLGHFCSQNLLSPSVHRFFHNSYPAVWNKKILVKLVVYNDKDHCKDDKPAETHRFGSMCSEELAPL